MPLLIIISHNKLRLFQHLRQLIIQADQLSARIRRQKAFMRTYPKDIWVVFIDQTSLIYYQKWFFALKKIIDFQC